MDAVWAGWAALYTHPRLYRTFAWLATRLRFLTPPTQSGWTHSRTPLKPAARSLRDLLAEQRRNKT
ncbi:MAG: lactate utilization protein LutB domain-containing protein, partial [Rhodocyclaceae bacterium]